MKETRATAVARVFCALGVASEEHRYAGRHGAGERWNRRYATRPGHRLEATRQDGRRATGAPVEKGTARPEAEIARHEAGMATEIAPVRGLATVRGPAAPAGGGQRAARDRLTSRPALYRDAGWWHSMGRHGAMERHRAVRQGRQIELEVWAAWARSGVFAAQ